MIGVRLEMEGIFIIGLRILLYNLFCCVEKVGFEIVDICF